MSVYYFCRTETTRLKKIRALTFHEPSSVGRLPVLSVDLSRLE